MDDLKLLTIFACAALLSTSCIAERQPESIGILGRINPRGLGLVNDVVADVLSAQVPNIDIPDLEGEAIWNYQFTDFRIERFQISNTTSFSTSSPNVITAAINDASFSIIGRFKLWKKVKVLFLSHTFRNKGSFRGTVTGVDVYPEIAVGRDESGKPTLTQTSCQSSISKLSLQAYGSIVASAVVETLDLASFAMRRFLNGLICPQLNILVSQRLKEILDQFSPVLPLPLDTSIDLGLVRPPVMGSDSIELAFSGRCFPTDLPNLRFNISTSSVMSLSNSTKMFQVAVSEYVINTFLASVIRNRLFRISLTEKQVRNLTNFEPSAWILSFLIPSLAPYEGKPLLFKGRPSGAPVVDLMEDSVNVLIRYELLVQVALGKDSYIEALSIKLAINATGSIEIDSNVISGRFDDIDVAILESGELPSPYLQSIIAGLMDRLVIPRVNKLTRKGFKIPPFYNFGIDKADLKMKENSIEISTDFMRPQAASIRRGM